MTTRDVIANAISGTALYPSGDDYAAADRVLCLDLAALLNPWREIETAPKDNTWIMISWGGQRDVAIVLGRWAHAHTLSPTHWLPLPAPPKEDKA